MYVLVIDAARDKRASTWMKHAFRKFTQCTFCNLVSLYHLYHIWKSSENQRIPVRKSENTHKLKYFFMHDSNHKSARLLNCIHGLDGWKSAFPPLLPFIFLFIFLFILLPTKPDNNYDMVVTCFIIFMNINRKNNRKRNRLNEFLCLVFVSFVFVSFPGVYLPFDFCALKIHQLNRKTTYSIILHLRLWSIVSMCSSIISTHGFGHIIRTNLRRKLRKSCECLKERKNTELRSICCVSFLCLVWLWA